MDREMIDKTAAKLKSDGWTILETTGFMHLIGPLWERKIDGQYEFALATQDKHHNRRGMVQGGVMTVRFTYRAQVIRIFGAGYWRKGKAIYERENQIHG